MKTVRLARPDIDSPEALFALVESGWRAGKLTSGAVVSQLEDSFRAHCGVSESVALSSCTSGLMLAPQALGLPAGSEVIVPSFTFAATGLALLWNGLVPVFCDCLPGTLTLDPDDVRRALSAKTAAICPVYVYGLPPDVQELTWIGVEKGLPIYFDSAQGLGATYQGRPAGGFGRCEVFSMSPTKVVTAIEGGLVTTNVGDLADSIRSMRDYGKDPDDPEDMRYLGLSARMSELHASAGLLSLRRIEELREARLAWIDRYRDRLGGLAGCRVQSFPVDRTSSGNYFVLFVGPLAKATRDQVHEALARQGIETKRYFHPPLHLQSIFQKYPMRVSSKMEETERASSEALALPLYASMTPEDFETVCRAVEALLA